MLDLLVRIVMLYGFRHTDVVNSPVLLVYDVLLSAVRDDSETSLYLSRYMDFLQKHIQVQVRCRMQITSLCV